MLLEGGVRVISFRKANDREMKQYEQKTSDSKDGEVRELKAEDFRRMRPVSEVLPPELLAILPKRKPGQRGPQKTPTKQQVTLRLDHDVLRHFRSKGPGWQSHINKSLRKAAGL